MNDPQVEQASRRLAGIAALRQLQRLVAADRAQEASKVRWTKRLAPALLLVCACAIGYVALRLLSR